MHVAFKMNFACEHLGHLNIINSCQNTDTYSLCFHSVYLFPFHVSTLTCKLRCLPFLKNKSFLITVLTKGGAQQWFLGYF